MNLGNEIFLENDSFCVEDFTDPYYVMDAVFLAIKRREDNDDSLVTRTCLNANLYMRVPVRDNGRRVGSYRITKEMLYDLNLSEDEVWRSAKTNTNSFKITSLLEALQVEEPDPCDDFLYVVRNGCCRGAACVLDYPEIFKRFCREHQEMGCYILPSSTEEVLIFGESKLFGKLRDFAEMVNDINRSKVEPELQLDPVVYSYDLITNQVTIAESL